MRTPTTPEGHPLASASRRSARRRPDRRAYTHSDRREPDAQRCRTDAEQPAATARRGAYPSASPGMYGRADNAELDADPRCLRSSELHGEGADPDSLTHPHMRDSEFGGCILIPNLHGHALRPRSHDPAPRVRWRPRYRLFTAIHVRAECCFAQMRIGVYIDGFNLYYGARGLCGRSTPGWRWLNLRSLAAT